MATVIFFSWMCSTAAKGGERAAESRWKPRLLLPNINTAGAGIALGSRMSNGGGSGGGDISSDGS